MKPTLLILKRRKILGKKTLPDTYFAVVDSENPKRYPANFVCMLPQDPKSYFGRPTYMPEFVKLFREQSLQIAIQMLHSALAKGHDPEVVKDSENPQKAQHPRTNSYGKCTIETGATATGFNVKMCAKQGTMQTR